MEENCERERPNKEGYCKRLCDKERIRDRARERRLNGRWEREEYRITKITQ